MPVSAPETLADVKAGDEVLITYMHPPRRPWIRDVVSRLTKTQIIVGSGLRFDRRFTPSRSIFEIRHGGHELHFGAMIGREMRHEVYNLLRPIRGFEPDQNGIIAMRDACDRAEAILRELGDWEDKP